MAIGLTAFLSATPRFVAASEILNVAVPDRGAWDSSYTVLGVQQGFFKEEGLDVRITYVADQAALESELCPGRSTLSSVQDLSIF
jgi:ABC-type nitrate/sulfonate/bicarbonate transport system substrate-binding protein